MQITKVIEELRAQGATVDIPPQAEQSDLARATATTSRGGVSSRAGSSRSADGTRSSPPASSPCWRRGSSCPRPEATSRSRNGAGRQDTTLTAHKHPVHPIEKDKL